MTTPAKLPPVPPEASVSELAAVLERALVDHGWLHTIDPFAGTGVPTVLACKGSRLLALLLLRTNQRPTVDQQRWLAALRRVVGIRAEAIRPEDAPAALRLLADPDAWRPL